MKRPRIHILAPRREQTSCRRTGRCLTDRPAIPTTTTSQLHGWAHLR